MLPDSLEAVPPPITQEDFLSLHKKLVGELRLIMTELGKDLNDSDSAFQALGARVEALAQKVSSSSDSIGSTEEVQTLSLQTLSICEDSQPAATDDVQALGARVEALAQKEPASQPEPEPAGFFGKFTRAGHNFFKSL